MTNGKYTVNIAGTLERVKNMPLHQGCQLLADTFGMPLDLAAKFRLELVLGTANYEIHNNTLTLKGNAE
jgi:hypothetical protein